MGSSQKADTRSRFPMSVKVAVAVGELLDKITILEIKASRLDDLTRLLMRQTAE